MKFKIKTPLMMFNIAAFLCYNAAAQQVSSELIGRSNKVGMLDVSPDGKWLLSWDGVTQNTPDTNPGDRLVWDLSTKKSRNLRNWSKNVDIYDQDCGWTPDNRIWHLYSYGQPPGDNPDPYTPTIRIETPDGKKKITCHDPDRKFWYDDQGYFDDKHDMKFSADGSKLFLLTNSYFRIFNTRTGNMLFRRRLAQREREEAHLSADGTQILAIYGQKIEYKIGVLNKMIDSGRWLLLDARTGRLIKRLKALSNVTVYGVSDSNLITYVGFPDAKEIFHARMEDMKVIWSEPVIQWPNFLDDSGIFTLYDKRNGNARNFSIRTDNWRSLKRAFISPDRKTFYTFDLDSQVFRFPAVELAQADKKLSPETQS